MFEVDVRTAALEGVMLHDKEGKPYWKLAYVCCREPCNNVLDECWCFTTKEAMVEAKELKFHCSIACWALDNPERFERSVEDFKTHIKYCDPEMYESTDWNDRDSWMWLYEEWLSESYDGCEMAEEIGADMECPL